MNQCPKCHSNNIEKFDMANIRQDNKLIEYIGEESPATYRCKDCDWSDKIKK